MFLIKFCQSIRELNFCNKSLQFCSCFKYKAIMFSSRNNSFSNLKRLSVLARILNPSLLKR